LANPAAAFVPSALPARATFTPRMVSAVDTDPTGNNLIVKKALTKASESNLLSKVAEAGLLSKAQDAGLSLSKLEPLLQLAADYPSVLVIAEAAGPDILPLLPTVVDLAPPVLPLLGLAVSLPPIALELAGLASLGAAAGIVFIVPDDTIASVAIQTLAFGVLGLAVPVASIGGAQILKKVFNP